MDRASQHNRATTGEISQAAARTASTVVASKAPGGAEGKLYRLPHVVLFAILAIVAGANSYRGIHSFIDVHLAELRDHLV